jgi:uridine phosphorylase
VRSGQEEVKMKKQHHIDLVPGDVDETVFIPGDVHRAKFIASHFDDAEFVAHKRQYVTYTGTYKGVRMSVTSTGIGCPALAIALETMIALDAAVILDGIGKKQEPKIVCP